MKCERCGRESFELRLCLKADPGEYRRVCQDCFDEVDMPPFVKPKKSEVYGDLRKMLLTWAEVAKDTSERLRIHARNANNLCKHMDDATQKGREIIDSLDSPTTSHGASGITPPQGTT